MACCDVTLSMENGLGWFHAEPAGDFRTQKKVFKKLQHFLSFFSSNDFFVRGGGGGRERGQKATFELKLRSPS